MSSDIRSILQRIVAIEEGKVTPAPGTVKSGLNAQQKSVPQLPALFKPKGISVLGAKTDPEHPMKGYAVGADESVESKKSALEEAMANIEEDMLSKVKADLNTYLDRLEKKIHDDGKRDKDATTDLDRLEKKTRIDRDLIDKAVRLVIFVIIIVFDPLAVLLLIAANQTYRRIREDKGEIEPIKRVVKKKKLDSTPSRTLESFFVDDKHTVIPKDKIADIGDINERT